MHEAKAKFCDCSRVLTFFCYNYDFIVKIPFWDKSRLDSIALADWLLSDGQQDKATGMLGLAENKLADAVENQERQMGDVLPTKFQTHVTSRTF